jgi:hypothetical protein
MTAEVLIKLSTKIHTQQQQSEGFDATFSDPASSTSAETDEYNDILDDAIDHGNGVPLQPPDTNMPTKGPNKGSTAAITTQNGGLSKEGTKHSRYKPTFSFGVQID